MYTRFQRWFRAVDAPDPLTYQTIILFQGILIGILIFVAPMIVVPFLVEPDLLASLIGSLSTLVMYGVYGCSLWLLRRGRFRFAVVLTVISTLLVVGGLLVVTGLDDGAALLPMLLIPVILAGLISGRKVMLMATGLTTVIIGLTLILELTIPEIAEIIEVPHPNYLGIITTFILALGIVVLLIERFTGALMEALTGGLARERELEALRISLEATVQERTATLEATLAEYRLQSAEQQALLEANRQQRDVIRMLSIPILPVGPRTLVLPLVGELSRTRMQEVQQRALEAVSNPTIDRAVLDITGVPSLDSETALYLLNIVRAIRLLGADAVLVGIRPEVAQMLVALGIDLHEIQTYATLQTALESHFG